MKKIFAIVVATSMMLSLCACSSNTDTSSNNEDVIVEAVMAAMKDVEGVSVVVHEHYYEVSPSPSRSAAICAGRAICKAGLGKFCVSVPKLFLSVEVLKEKEEKNDEKKTDRMD